MSCGGNGEDHESSLLYCVPQLCTVICTLTPTVFTCELKPVDLGLGLDFVIFS